MATLSEIEALYEQIRQQYTPEARIIADVLQNEIKRRKNAGRTSSGISRREQNRLAQAKWRKNKGEKLLTSK